MKLGFIILAHDEPATIAGLVKIIVNAGHRVVVHFDANAPADLKKSVQKLEQVYDESVRVISVIHCKWGEWSLVEAVLCAMSEFEKMPDPPDYIHLMSGADMPIRPIADMQSFLQQNPNQDFIESYDISKHCWVKGGPSIERFQFFYPVNFRTSRTTFDLLYSLQRRLKICRKIPLGMIPHMGSQWWTLRWTTCQKILGFVKKNPRLAKYFRTTWIPDETFFPTLIAHLIQRSEIANVQLILHHLTPNGRPYIIYSDHMRIVRKLPHFFVRKVAPSARNAILETMNTRNSRIPHVKNLVRVHNLICDAIDQSYKFKTIVPGRTTGNSPKRKVNLIIIFLTKDDKASAGVITQADKHSKTICYGRPFAPRSIELSTKGFARTGLSRNMTALREAFPEQFIDAVVGSFCENAINVMVVQTKDDIELPELFKRIPEALIVKTYLSSDDGYLPKIIRYTPEHDINQVLDEIGIELIRLNPSMNKN